MDCGGFPFTTYRPAFSHHKGQTPTAPKAIAAEF